MTEPTYDSSNWPYRVRIFAPINQGGHLLIETCHRTTASRDTEIAAARSRRLRGEVGRIERLDYISCIREDL